MGQKFDAETKTGGSPILALRNHYANQLTDYGINQAVITDAMKNISDAVEKVLPIADELDEVSSAIITSGRVALVFEILGASRDALAQTGLVDDKVHTASLNI